MILGKSLSPRLIKNRISLLKSYLRKEIAVKGFPLELAIEVTNHCNVDCIMCPRQKMTRSKGFMDFNLFKKIIDEVKGYTELVFLHLAGEPLLHPQLRMMIDYCARSGISSALSTNATLLNADKSQELLRSPLDLLILSFDGVTKETYQAIRRNSDFKITYNNIMRVLSIKDKMKTSPYIIIQLIYMKQNVSEVREFLSKWKSRKVDAVRIKPYLNYPGLDNYLGELPKKSSIGLKPCVLLWRQLAIYWDGTVVSCCQDFLSQRVIGDVNKQSIRDIWNGQEMAQMRLAHAKGLGRSIPLCKECTMPQLSLPVLLGMVFFEDLVIKKIVPKVEELTILRSVRGISYFT